MYALDMITEITAIWFMFHDKEMVCNIKAEFDKST